MQLLFLVVVVLAFMSQVIVIQSFATHFTSDYCERPMKAGVVVMGKPIKYSTEKSISIYSQSLPNIGLVNDSVVNYLDKIAVKLEPKSFQMVLEIDGAIFTKGACGGKRTNTNHAVIDTSNLPSGLTNITLTAAWAKTYSGGVEIAPTIFFQFLKETPDL